MSTENEEKVDLVDDEARVIEEYENEQNFAELVESNEEVTRGIKRYKMITAVFGVLSVIALVARLIAML